jgi:hypothetical protein
MGEEKPNFFDPDCCQAFDRSEEATCAFFEPTPEGWCKHHYRTVKGKKNPVFTGECHSQRAADAHYQNAQKRPA